MSSVKAALKAAKAALDAQEYETAAEEARKALENDAKNYHANVFLGLALEKQDKYEESEKAYQTAAANKADDALVWQGLVTLFEKQGGKKLDDYADVARNLGQIYAGADDAHKCQTVVDRYVDFARKHGNRRQLRQAYDIMIPGSPVYDCIAGRVPKPDFVYMRIAELIETDEKEQVDKLIAERRTRLGARIAQVTADVKKEVYTSSDLESLYQGIIDYTHDDKMRREYEEKLLRRSYDILGILPTKDKAMKLPDVQKLAEGMVIIKIPVELAWQIVLEWKDVEGMNEWDVMLLRQYIDLFPEDGFTKVLKGFFGSEICPFPKPEPQKGAEAEEPKEDEQQDEHDMTAEERLTLMIDGLESSSQSVLSQRIMAEYYLYLEEYASAVETSRQALELIKQEQKLTGLKFQNRIDGANIVLATSLIYHQSPRHHHEARTIFEDIVMRKSSNVPALVGIGMIMEEDEEYGAAKDFLFRAWKQNPTLKVRSEAAWCNALTGEHEEALKELQACLDELSEEKQPDSSLKAELLYRIGECMWNLDTSKAARKDRNGAYARWLQCLQLNINHAQAYTSLGMFYADYARDRKRARKCFQKAFELSPSEIYAAERLARAFADVKDWDLVETVAKRVKDSGKTRPPPGSKRKAIGWPYAALGVCYINNQSFSQAVPEFNAALRINPGDYHSLVGLGECYHNLGRFVAATRVFQEARKYEDSVPESDTWFCRYMLANVHRDLGAFDEAAEAYEKVLEQKPSEFGVSLALLQTFVEQAWHNTTLGLFGRAAQSVKKAIYLAEKVAENSPDAFNLWKALGEACAIYATLGDYVQEIPHEFLKQVLSTGSKDETYQLLSDIDEVQLASLSNDSSSTQASTTFAIHAAILCYKRGIAASSKDIHAQAVSWYNLGWIEYRAHTAPIPPAQQDKPKKRSSKYLQAAVRGFKRSIELEARNADFWNALGIVTTPLNAQVAQHSFIRSLYLNDKSASVWTNLGVLYLLENDIELAHQAFTRGQSADPSYAHAWVGQGILALVQGKAEQARASFTHAFEIGDSTSVITKKLFATSSFDYVVTAETAPDITQLLQPLLALHQLRTQAPSELAFHHLSSLFAERIGSHEDAIESLQKVTEAVEAEYEQDESPEVLARFAQVQADLARAHLACGHFEDAIEQATTALDLSAEEESGARDPAARTKYRLSAHLTAGLAYARTDQANESIAMFRSALTESDENPDVICLLAQVLWAKGSEKERNVAREQLLDSVEKHPEHPGSIILLSVIALLDDDKETLEAIAGDLSALRTKPGLSEHNLLSISKIFEALAQLQPEVVTSEPGLAEQAAATSNIMLAPSKPYGWAQLSAVANDPHAAEMALQTARSAVPPRGTLTAAELARMQAATHRVADAQRSIMLAPWVVDGWKEFGAGVTSLM